MTRNGFGIGDVKVGAYGKIWENKDVRTGAKIDLFYQSQRIMLGWEKYLRELL